MITQYNQEYQESCLLISIGTAIRTHWFPMNFKLEGTSTVDESNKQAWHPMTICKQKNADQLGNSQPNEMLH